MEQATQVTPNDPILSEREAAAYLDAKPDTMRTWRYRRVGPPYLKFTGKIRYRLSDIKNFIEQSRVVPSESKPKRRRRAA
jgi:Helix-turn-helix domain